MGLRDRQLPTALRTAAEVPGGGRQEGSGLRGRQEAGRRFWGLGAGRRWAGAGGLGA